MFLNDLSKYHLEGACDTGNIKLLECDFEKQISKTSSVQIRSCTYSKFLQRFLQIMKIASHILHVKVFLLELKESVKFQIFLK